MMDSKKKEEPVVSFAQNSGETKKSGTLNSVFLLLSHNQTICSELVYSSFHGQVIKHSAIEA